MVSILVFVAQCAAIFVASTTVFDAVHYMLHRWRHSRFSLFRVFASWHQVHHDFLDKQMQVHPELKWRNIWAHLVPEFATSILGTIPFLLIFDPWAVAAICALHIVLFVFRVKEEGVDAYHMSMERLRGARGALVVTPAYHAMHHINPMAFYSSFLNIFDMIFGTALNVRGHRVLITGASGAFGSRMREALMSMGAKAVDTVSLAHMTDEEIDALPVDGYDLLVMAHGLKDDDSPDSVWRANYAVPIRLGERLIAAGRERLVPPEIWAVGSEAEVFGDSDYAASKREFADYAADRWFHSEDVTYRHIVPSAFTSKMGRGLMDARVAVAWSLFLIRRGFRYIPVTYTGIALLNRVRFAKLLAGHSERTATAE